MCETMRSKKNVVGLQMKESDVSEAALGFYCLTISSISPLKVIHQLCCSVTAVANSKMENEMHLVVPASC